MHLNLPAICLFVFYIFTSRFSPLHVSTHVYTYLHEYLWFTLVAPPPHLSPLQGHLPCLLWSSNLLHKMRLGMLTLLCIQYSSSAAWWSDRPKEPPEDLDVIRETWGCCLHDIITTALCLCIYLIIYDNSHILLF